MTINIKSKYTIVILSLILLMVTALSIFSYIQFDRMSSTFINSSSQLMTHSLLDETKKRGMVISSLLAESLINPLYNYEIGVIDEVLISFKSYHSVVGIYVYDTEGMILHDGTENVETYGTHMEDGSFVDRILADRTPLTKMTNDFIEIYNPVSLGEQLLGGVKVVLSLAEMKNHIGTMTSQLAAVNLSRSEKSYRYLLIASSLIILIGILLSYTLASRISTPINKLAKYAGRVGRGHYDNRLEHTSNDEIGELVSAFNNMQFNLKKSTISIQELEKQIELRTRELARANEELKQHKEQLEQIVSVRTTELLEANRCLTQEIEERKIMQEKLVRSQKMEAIGTLAAGVAHDLNNILSGMVGIPDMILMDLPEKDPLIDDILLIKKSGLKAAAVVQDLLNLARRNVAYNTILDMGIVLREYLDSPEHKELLNNHPNLEVYSDIQSDKRIVSGSQVHLTKMLMNLISNAAESMPDGGTITVSLRSQFIDPSKGQHKEFKKGNYVVIQIQDNGDGIPAENLERIFEPFYTTKTMGRSGSGLGLTVISETVKDHNGYIKVRSGIGKGTTFTIYIPSTNAKPTANPNDALNNNYRGNGESILVVDDLESQRTLLKKILEKLGYYVSTVHSGEDAVEYMKGHSADLLILDMIMPPGIDGLETYQQIASFKPEQKAIVASGYYETARLKQMQEMGVFSCVRKPYTSKQIGMAVRRELDR